MTVSFASSYFADFKGGNSINATDAFARDGNYTPQCVKINVGYNMAKPMWVNTPVHAGDYWLHFNFYSPRFDSDSNGSFLSFTNLAAQTIAKVELLGGLFYAQAVGDTTVDGGTFTVLIGTLTTFDVKVSVGANIVVTVYMNGTLASTATAANVGGKLGIVKTQFDNDDIVENYSTQNLFYSEVIITDGEDTRGWRLSTLTPTADGFYTDWAGGHAELTNDVSLSGVSSGIADERYSYAKSAYAGAASPASIRAVIASALGSKGVTGPQNFNHFLRIASTNYDATSQTFVDPLEPVIAVWDNNPNTAAPWTVAGLATFEAGLQSLA